MIDISLKENLLEYLKTEKELIENSIEAQASLSYEEKIEQGLLAEVILVERDLKESDKYILFLTENFTKWRIGDKVIIFNSIMSWETEAVIVENLIDRLLVKSKNAIVGNTPLLVRLEEALFSDTLIKILENVNNSSDENYFLKSISGQNEIGYSPLGVVSPYSEILDEEKINARDRILRRPYLFALQGPPGTGKTKILANIALSYVLEGKNVLITALTHQAVNNALNAISKYEQSRLIPLIKIGEKLKGTILSENIKQWKNLIPYDPRHKSKTFNKVGSIIGMTVHSAIINYGLCNSKFLPSVVLIDEASQIPLSIGSLLGIIGAASFVFFGDDRQLPPIFQSKLISSPYSTSIFEFLKSKLKDDFKTSLLTTYRMNYVICKYVSKNFYEPEGISLKSFSEISKRKIKEERIEESIEIISINSSGCKDYNEEEGKKAYDFARRYKSQGYRVAIVTPFRKQVNLIRKITNENIADSSSILIDTVERLQGQEVDVIIFTTSVSCSEYYMTVKHFIEDKKRLNVIFSRAKRKVVIIKSPLIKLPGICDC